MKILLITFLYDHKEGGGASKSVADIADGLIQYGHDVVVLTSCKKEQNGSVDFINGIKVYRVFPSNLYWIADKDRHPVWEKFFWQLIDTWNPFIFSTLQQIISAEKPDVAHVHKMRGFSAAVWTGLAKFGVLNIVQTCHDYEAISPEGTLVSRVGQMALKGNLLLRPYQHIRAAASRHVAAVTAPSQATMNIIHSRGFFGNAKQYIVPNSHGLSNGQLEAMAKDYSGKAAGHPSADINLLYIGRLEKNKGINLLCEIFEQLSSQYPQFKLHIAGFGTQEGVLTKRYQDHPSIIFHGPVYGEQKSRLYASSDVVIIPSLWPEVFGIVIIEAFAHGKPVIGTNLGGIPESIKTDFNGWIIPELSRECLEDVFSGFLLLTDQQRISIRDHCFASAGIYTTEKVMKMYIDIYESSVKCNSEFSYVR